VNGIKIRIDKSKLSVENREALEQFGNKFMKITIRSGNLRYRSESMSQLLFSGSINNDLFADGDSVYIDTPLNGDELRNPRGEDVDAANKLLHHLNENLEYYHKAVWFDMTPERRYMLLDGIIAPGKANGRSVASVVENRLIGIAGNSLIMPVAPGNQLDPTINDDFNLFEQYFNEENDPVRISLPTKGVYAESVMGKCNSCEEKDNSRFWRWEESPIPDSPNTQILPLNTDTRRADPGNLQPKDFPNPVVNIQNAPNAPDPVGLQKLLDLLSRADAFRDLTGLNQNQLNALATYQKTLETAQSFGKEAAELAKAAATIGMAKDAHESGGMTQEDYRQTVKDQTPPSPAKEREQADQDVQKIQEDKEADRLEDGQAKDITEDRRRKSHGTEKPAPTAPRKAKKKYNLTLIMRTNEDRPLIGTWVLNFGSLIEETFESTNDGVVRFQVELDPSKDQVFGLRGNPFITGTSLMPGAENYYHYIVDSPVVGTNPNLTFQVNQRRHKQTIRTESNTSESEAKVKAVETEFGSEIESTGGSGALVGLFAEVSITAKIAGKRTWSDSTTGTTSSGGSSGLEWDIIVPVPRLKLHQKGQPDLDINIEE
jgi:hypothetical protein